MIGLNPLRRAVVERGAPLLVASLCAYLAAAPATAQNTNVAVTTPPPASTTGNGPIPIPPPSQRDADYAALARDVQTMEREFGIVKRVVKLITPAVVHIESKPLPKFQGLLHVEEAGSGVIVQFESKYYVITNRHVIRHSSPEKIEVHLLDGRVLHPTQIWSDSETDVAALSIDADNLAAARLGDSDSLEIGDFVLAVGSPFGLSQSVTRGIVSAKGRHNLDLGDDELKWQNFIQTDAAINPGNSGGPLVNLRGEVVGLNTAIASASGGNEGIGFSIPINIVARTAHALVDNHHVPRGFLGVKLDINFNQQRAQALGLGSLVGTRVSKIEPKSPAERANLQVNDVILEFNGVRVDQDVHLISLVKLTEIGRRVPITIMRDGKMMNVDVEIADASNYKESEE
ncbi:MAG TPA: trypsin-like peptidase domain-containing protein [Lacipirellulaceae bacterium]|nr:trypsin-like peptidase domain-containing protein [Lacipirellulaceae bacterium]